MTTQRPRAAKCRVGGGCVEPIQIGADIVRGQSRPLPMEWLTLGASMAEPPS